MKVLLSWLQEFAPFPSDDPAALGDSAPGGATAPAPAGTGGTTAAAGAAGAIRQMRIRGPGRDTPRILRSGE